MKVDVLVWTRELLSEIEVRPQDTLVSSGAPKHTRLESTHVRVLAKFDSPASLTLPQGSFHEGNEQAERANALTTEMTGICTMMDMNGTPRYC